MNTQRRSASFLSVVFLFLFGAFTTLFSQDVQPDKSGSPYFIVLSEGDEEATMPLQSTDVDVTIAGVMANVTVKQTYHNSGKSTIEAVYVFPASTRAAVYNMVMKIGDREIVAKIDEKDKAKKTYETAKKEGKTASLLEEGTPNVFKMNVANIIPGATVVLTMSYTELLVPTDKTYEFVYPTVVGPRYVSRSDKKTLHDAFTGNPYLQQHSDLISSFNLAVKLNTGVPIQAIICETHKNKIDYEGECNASILIDESKGGDRDFVLKYRLAGDEIETGLLVYDNPEGEKFFMAMIQPQEVVVEDEMPAREYIFILDVSGSMMGFPIEVTKILFRNLLKRLKKTDLFNIVFFAGESYMYSNKSLPITDENVDRAIMFLNSVKGGGGTELQCALEAAMQLNNKRDFARSFLIFTDGFINVETQTFDYIRDNLGEANFFSFGIGGSVNRFLIEGMAHVGYGEPFFILHPKDAEEQAEKFIKYISTPVLTNISYSFDNFDAYDVLPQKVPDLFANRPVIITGKYRGELGGSVKLKGTSGKSTISKVTKIEHPGGDNSALKYLWAREKIRLIGDYRNLIDNIASHDKTSGEQLKSEITNLGLTYNLLTKYTSFVAVDSEISNPGGFQESVTQPLPLPQGVSVNAIPALGIVASEEEEVEDTEVFNMIEKMPRFPGGDAALMKFLKDNTIYPPYAFNAGIEGRVFVNFVVDSCGNISHVKVVRAVYPLLDAEALRVVKSMPKWTPGEQRGKKVSTSINLPVNFVLQTRKNNSSTVKKVVPVQPSKYQRHPYIVQPCR